MKRTGIMTCFCLLSMLSRAQSVTLTPAEIESIKNALSGHEIFQRNYSADRAVGYERDEGKVSGAPNTQQALRGFTLSDVQQKGDFLLLYGNAKLYLRKEGTQDLVSTRTTSPAVVAIYLPGFADTESLLQGLTGEVFFPNGVTALASVPEWLKACVPQIYSPTTKSILPVGKCSADLKDTTTQPPKLTKQTDPMIPSVMRGLAGEWDVLISLVVDAGGQATAVHPMRPSSSVPPLKDWKQLSEKAGKALDDSAIAAVASYKFKPAMKDGSPVPYHLFVDVDFKVF